MRAKFIPYAVPVIEPPDIEAATAVLKSGMLTTGPTIGVFEEAFASLCRARHAVSCSSGTAALQLVARALSVSARSTVVVPAITFLATANAFALEGARIVFADVDARSGLMTPETAQAAIDRAGGAADAIVAVHLGGRIADMAGLRAVADRCGATLVEDACHAVGSILGEEPSAEHVGECRLSAAATFSFHPTKTITTGEGGMVTTAEPRLAETMRRFRNHGMSRTPPFENTGLALDPQTGKPNPWYYEMSACGTNLRLSDIHAAIGVSQLARFEAIRAHRHRLRQLYDRAFAGHPACLPAGLHRPERLVDHLYQVAIDFAAVGKDRARVMQELAGLGIGTQVHYIPVCRQPHYARLGAGAHPGADAFYSATLSLPFSSAVTAEDAGRVVAAIQQVLGTAPS